MVILAGDHIYKMDYELMLQQHVDQGADVTVGCLEVPRMEATGFGVMHVDEQDRIIAFLEKPADPPGIPGQPGHGAGQHGHLRLPHRASCSTSCAATPPTPTRAATSARTSSPTSSSTARRWRTASPHSCVRSSDEAEAYWRDVGTVDAYWEANIDLTDIIPALDLYDQNWPIWTYAEITPPAKFVHDEDGRRGIGGDARWSRAAASSPAPACGARCCSPACASTPTPRLEEAVVLPDVEIGRNARLTQRGHRPRRAASPRAWSSARTRSSTPSASAAPRTASA